MRALILIHRYLGIGIGVVMAMWCLSGIVMMYVRYPALDPQTRLHALSTIKWQHCCAFAAIESALGVDAFDAFDLEMVADRLVLRAHLAEGTARNVDVRTGAVLQSFDRAAAQIVASRFHSQVSYLDSIERDQWTVSGAFNTHRPLHRFALDDDRGSELYVSSKTGEAVQLTTRVERFWNWLGSVPHWLYPTVLRQHVTLWSQVVIWLSLAGVFLTVIGVYIGIDHWRAMNGKRLSPYRGVPLWHHVSGLFFGILTLTWVGSGLISMSPWGLFEGGDAREEREQVRDMWIGGHDIVNALRALATQSPSAVRIASAPLQGRLFLLIDAGTEARRVSTPSLASEPLSDRQLHAIAATLSGKHAFDLSRLDTGDEYYYQGHDRRVLPVYRVLVDNNERTRYYLDARSGEVLEKIDANRRWYRWLFEGLHRFDFAQALRQRPLWDAIVLPLLLGVTLVCLTGVYMGYRRLAKRA